MELFDSFKLTILVNNHYDLLKKIANALVSSKYPRHEEISSDFMNAVDNYDSEKVNEIIEKYLCQYLNCTYLYDGLNKFCHKFDIDVDVTTADISTIITSIYLQKNKIIKLLSEKGVKYDE